MSDSIKNSVIAIMGVQAVIGTGKYLGLPSMIGRDRSVVFGYVKDRVWQRINNWSSKCLSKAGMEIMIKSVLQAIPSYVMSIFLLPNSIINTIEKMMNSFWWGHGSSGNRGIHWMSWERLVVHKSFGGMDFKDLYSFNLAMLGNQGWKFQTDSDSLVTRIFKARYFPNMDYLSASLGHNPSIVWRSIFQAQSIVRGGERWCIGIGSRIPILNELWLLNGSRIDKNIAGAHFVRDFTVQSLIHPSHKSWNSNIVHQVFNYDIANLILRTPLLDQVVEDSLVWKAEKNGVYYVRSAYRLYVDEIVDTSPLRRTSFWTGIWKLKVPPKVKNLIWRMCRGCLPTRVRIQDKGVQCPTSCVICNDPAENLDHICFLCPFPMQV